jgi:hypothetical protein
MGHREDVWTNPIFQEILSGGIRFALGEVKADATPNLEHGRTRMGHESPIPQAKAKNRNPGAAAAPRRPSGQ